MGQVLKLEEFDAAFPHLDKGKSAPQEPGDDGAGSPAYEAGYRAGWDDAIAAELDNQNRISAEFANNLEDFGFNFHEAKSHILRSLRPLLTELLEKFLPKAIAATRIPAIADEIMALAETSAGAPIDVMVSPKSAMGLRALLETGSSVNLNLVEEPSIPEGQILLRNGTLEKEIDTGPALEQIQAALNALYDFSEKVSHG